MLSARAAVPLLAVITLATYANSFSGTFEGDSGPLVTLDSRVSRVDAHNLRLIFGQEYWYPLMHAGLYRPIVTLSWMFNYAVLGNGDNAAGYHAVNLALHLANVLLAWLLALRLWKAPLPAFVTAAIFAVHPVNTEAVTNIAGRADLMAALGVLSALVLHAAPRRAFTLPAIFAAALFAFFSKESAVVLPAAMLLYDVLFRRRQLRSIAPGYLAVAPALVIMAITRYWLFSRLPVRDLPFVDNPLSGADFLTARLTALQVLWRYIALLLWPRRLSWDYSYNQIPLATALGGLIALAGLVALLVTLTVLARRAPAVTFSGLFFFLALVPTSNLLFFTGSIMAERLVYLPSIGFAGSIVALISALAAHRRWRTAVLAVIVAALGARAVLRNREWTDGAKLWQSAVNACPRSFRTQIAPVYAFLRQGLKLSNIDPAIAYAEKSVSIVHALPPIRNTTIPYTTLAMLYLAKGDLLADSTPSIWYRKALDTLQQAVPIDRAYTADHALRELAASRSAARTHAEGSNLLYDRLAEAHRRLQQFPEAARDLREEARLTPLEPKVYLQMADLERAMGRAEASAIHLWQAIAVGPPAGAELELTETYRTLDPSGCAIVDSQLNRACPLVARHICAAWQDLATLLAESGWADEAARYRRQSGCPAP